MATTAPVVVGYLATPDITTAGSPYGSNQKPAAGTVAADMSVFYSSTPTTDNTPAGSGTFLFQLPVASSSQSKVLGRNYIIQQI